MAHLSKNQQGETILRDDWHIDDVRSVLEDDETLTDDECIEVLERLAHSFDANFGINWDVIRYQVEYMLDIQQKYSTPINEELKDD